MKKQLPALILALLIAAMLSACAGKTEETQSTPAPTQVPTPVPTEEPVKDPYEDIIRQYIVHDGTGSCTMDLDGDGTEELFIGPTAGDVYQKQQISAMYACKDGEVKELFVASDRDLYYISENGTIVEENILSTYDKCYNYYAYANGELTLLVTVGFDVARDKDHPWYKTENGEQTTVDEMAAIEFLQAYQNTYRTLPYV